MKNKYKKLALGLLFDTFGYASFAFPMLDIVWAPLSAYLMTKMYKGKDGKIAAAITFVEEAMPFLDVIPTFTLMWLYTFVFKKEKETTIEV
ncbi:hypothetical protein [Tenacibaculum aquimarinum]|uniref:hypothetical protein n=1 Tax=Tenacibaculum aquimarinum TaxID=2910675 RepID=UPI001F0A946D|nr:hypothetical protein [Tenacibaculum aquimarinum]MCH3884813.1 hypothetical protein [Tenacibaculum aquimarinum]